MWRTYASAGVAWHLRARAATARPLLLCFVASFLLLWYANSCWECWWFGDAFGGRGFLELAGFFSRGLAGAFEAMRRAGPGVRRAFAAFVVVALLYHFTLMGLYISHAISRQDYLF